MNVGLLYIIAAGLFLLFGVTYAVLKWLHSFKGIETQKATKILKLTLSIFAIVAFLSAIYFNKPAMATEKGVIEGTLDPAVGNLHLIGVPYGSNRFLNLLAWLSNALFFPAAIVTILTSFIPFKIGKLFNKWISLPILLLEFSTLFNLVNAIYGSCDFTWRTAIIAAAVGSAFALSLINFVEDFKETKETNWREVIDMLVLFVVALISFMPVETLATLNSTEGYVFGSKQTDLRMYDLNELHRFMIYVAIAYGFVLYFVFRNKEKHVIKVVLLVVSLGTLRVFLGQFSFQDMFPIIDGKYTVNVKNLPIHLCHTAMFVVPITIACNSKKLFYFTYFINVFGAGCAIMMPNMGEHLNVYHWDVIAYWVNHFSAFGMPLLCVALKLFDRPKFKQMLWSLGFFGIYFVVIMFMNAWFSNYVEGGTDYLFINSDFILSKLFNEVTSAQILNNTFTWNWGSLSFTIRPLYQSLFFIVYVVVAFAMWFVYSLFFRIGDSHKDLHNMLVIARKEHISMKLKYANEEVVETNEITLKFDEFVKRYGNSQTLSADHVNLEVRGGQIFGFLGPNGAGKSTSIKCAIGIQPVTDGHIYVCGKDVTTQPVQTKKLIGYVPDHYALYEKLTGREYINYIADLYGVSKADRDARIEKYVNLFELQQAFDNRMQTYSHGMKQKITIIAALVHDPKIWILDEPLTGLDPQSIFQVKECMKAHAAAGNIVFFSSHIIDVVEKLCTRIAIVKKGHIVYEADMTQVQKDHPEGLEAFYLSTIHDNGDLDN